MKILITMTIAILAKSFKIIVIGDNQLWAEMLRKSSGVVISLVLVPVFGKGFMFGNYSARFQYKCVSTFVFDNWSGTVA